MNSLPDSFKICGPDLHQLVSIVSKDRTEISRIKNDEPASSLIGPLFSTLPINAGSMKNVDSWGGSLSQCFSRLTQQAVFAFLVGNGEVEKLPCYDFSSIQELHGLSRSTWTMETDDQTLNPIKDAAPSQRSIFNFLHGDVCLMDFNLGSEQKDHFIPDTCEDLRRYLSLLDLENSPDGSACIDKTRHSILDNELCSEFSLKFRVTDQITGIRDDVPWMITGTTVENAGFSGEIDENILHSPFHYSQKNVEIASVSDWDLKGVKLGASQCPSIENFSGMFSMLNCNIRISQKNSEVALENYESTNGTKYEGDVSGISSPLSSNERIPSIFNHSEVDEDHYKNSDSASIHRFDYMSNSLKERITKIQNNSTAYFRDVPSSNAYSTSGYQSTEKFGFFKQYPVMRCTEELAFAVPDADQIMDYLHGDLSSPKFLESKTRDEDSVVFEAWNSDESVGSNKLSDCIISSSVESIGNDVENVFSDIFDVSIQPGIEASIGAFGEIETSAGPSLPEPSHVEKIRWNWASRNVYASSFDFEDHQNLLELYELDDMHIHAYDEEFCESPTWPEKNHIQKNELCSVTSNKLHDDVIWMEYLAPISTTVKEDGFTEEIAPITTTGNTVEKFSRSYMDSPKEHCREDSDDVTVFEKNVEHLNYTNRCSSIENNSGLWSKLNRNAGILEETTKADQKPLLFALAGSTNENSYEGIMAGPSFNTSIEKMQHISQLDEKRYKSSVSKMCYHQSFDNVSNGTSGQSSSGVFGNCGQHPADENTDELTFAIPDPDELMEYLHGSLSSPKFLKSDSFNEETDQFHFLSHAGNPNLDKVAESEYLSDSITNSSTVTGVNDNKNEIFDSFGSETESQIGAMTGSFGEIETPAIPSFSKESQVKKIRRNWASREADYSLFNLNDHLDLLDLYGLNDQDVQAYEGDICESPTWPEKQ